MTILQDHVVLLKKVFKILLFFFSDVQNMSALLKLLAPTVLVVRNKLKTKQTNYYTMI